MALAYEQLSPAEIAEVSGGESGVHGLGGTVAMQQQDVDQRAGARGVT